MLWECTACTLASCCAYKTLLQHCKHPHASSMTVPLAATAVSTVLPKITDSEDPCMLATCRAPTLDKVAVMHNETF